MEGFNWFIIYLKYMESKNEIGFQLIYVFDQWPWLRNPSWLEAPSVREYPQQNMAKHMVLTYLHVLDPEDLPLISQLNATPAGWCLVPWKSNG